MRRTIGLVLIALGVALIGLAIALPTYVYPRVAKAPADPDQNIVAEGTGVTLFLPRGLDAGGPRILENQHVTVTRRVDGEVRPGARKLRDGENFYRLAFSADVEGQGLLNAYVEGASFDGKTGEATNCCDYLRTDPEDEVGQPIAHEGLIFKFPFDTRRKDYPFWDVNVKRAATARFDGTERLKGLLTYRFVQPIPDEVIGTQDLPGSLLNLPDSVVTADRVYATTRTLWIEPNTGAIIKGSEQVNQRFVAQGKQIPVIQGTLTYNDETVAALVDKYKGSALELRVVTKIAPIVFWILGPILVLVGVTLIALGRRERQPHDNEDYYESGDARLEHA